MKLSLRLTMTGTHENEVLATSMEACQSNHVCLACMVGYTSTKDKEILERLIHKMQQN